MSKELKKWERFREDIKRSTSAPVFETVADKRKRLDKHAKDRFAFMSYHFPTWASAKFAPWHKELDRTIYSRSHILAAYAIHREAGKTTFMQMETMWAALHGEAKFVIWVSKTQENANNMLAPIREMFEHNDRITHDYGIQRNLGHWEQTEFTIKEGCKFLALGKGQSPRGLKMGEVRPDWIVVDDIDDDEEVLNVSRLDKSWDWMMGALFGATSISERTRFIVLNNIIAEDSLMQRTIKIADHHRVINLLNTKGQPTWPERYTLEQCQHKIAKMGSLLAQREYFNNPLKPGTIFKREWITYTKRLHLGQYRFILSYLDPAFKNTKTADHKAMIVVGLTKDGHYHILKAYCAVASVEDMIEWHYDLSAWITKHNGSVEFWMEEVFLQDLLYKDFDAAAKAKGVQIPIRGDKRAKPNKDVRIMSMAGYFERGHVMIAETERDNHHMANLVAQLTGFQPAKTGIPKDGPDALEGAIHLLNQRNIQSQPPIIGSRKGRSTSSNRRMKI